MMVMYALERRGRGFVLAFACGSELSSAYGFLAGTWPFGVVEAIWAVVAIERDRGMSAEQTSLTTPALARRLPAELLGSAFLAALVIGSGTAAGLYTIILMFGPVSGGHFNPVVSLADASFGGISWRDALAYLSAQVAGCVLGAVVANGMFSLAAISISTHHRATGAHLFSGRRRRFAEVPTSRIVQLPVQSRRADLGARSTAHLRRSTAGPAR
jgi:hypothetical protein